MKSSWRILIVDDNHDFATSIRSALDSWANVRTTIDPAQALQLLTQWQPQIVIVDPVLRTGDSLDFLMQLLQQNTRYVFCCLTPRIQTLPRILPPHSVLLPRHLPLRTVSQFLKEFLQRGSSSQEHPLHPEGAPPVEGRQNSPPMAGSGQLSCLYWT